MSYASDITGLHLVILIRFTSRGNEVESSFILILLIERKFLQTFGKKQQL